MRVVGMGIQLSGRVLAEGLAFDPQQQKGEK